MATDERPQDAVNDDTPQTEMAVDIDELSAEEYLSLALAGKLSINEENRVAKVYLLKLQQEAGDYFGPKQLKKAIKWLIRRNKRAKPAVADFEVVKDRSEDEQTSTPPGDETAIERFMRPQKTEPFTQQELDDTSDRLRSIGMDFEGATLPDYENR